MGWELLERYIAVFTTKKCRFLTRASSRRLIDGGKGQATLFVLIFFRFFLTGRMMPPVSPNSILRPHVCFVLTNTVCARVSPRVPRCLEEHSPLPAEELPPDGEHAKEKTAG